MAKKPVSPFRQAALDRLSSPEQLDQLLEVTRPRAWVALLGLWMLIGVALAWSIFGRLPVTITGTGILLSSAGLRDVEAQGSGIVQSLTVREGDLVEKGALIAQISQPKLEQDVAQAADRRRMLLDEKQSRQRYLNTNTALETERLVAERGDLDRRLLAARERSTYLERRLASEREARTLGLLTEADVQATVQTLESLRADVAGLTQEQQNNALKRLVMDNNSTETIGAVEDRIRDADRDMAARQLALTQASRVISPYRGYVREIRSNVGQLATAGQALLSIELAGVPVQAVVFVSTEGKSIERGMDARISPVTVRQEEFGYMLGKVTSVSTQPVTIAGMTRTLGNDILVQQIAAQGAPFLVEISLVPDTSTVSGFKWSSRQGPPQQVGSGTSITVSVVVSRRRPISLLLPLLRSAFGTAA